MTRPPASEIYDATVGDDIQPWSPTMEVGLTGLKRTSGYIRDEFLPQLRGPKGVEIFREMWNNSGICAAYVFTVMQLLRQIEWAVEPASNSREDRANAEFVEQNMQDMEHSWGDFIGEACSFIPYGWSVHEIVYKFRRGPRQRDPRYRSQFNDGKLGWRMLPIRGQESLIRWKYEKGRAVAMVQMPAPTYQRIVLDLEKCLHFRTRLNKDNPEGYSLLRPMYRDWWYVKRLEEIEAIGVERDLTGLPMAMVPPRYMNPQTPQEKATLDAIKAVVEATRRNEREGIIWPLEYEGDSNKLTWDFKLLTSGGSRQFDISGIIQRHETRMLQSAMADFIMTGHEDSGASYALHTDKSGIFETGVNGLAQALADPFNRKGIPDLFRHNRMYPERLPQLVPNNVNPPALPELGAFLTALAGVGLPIFPNPALEKFVFDAARLPQPDKNILEAHAREQREAAVISLAQRKLEMIQVEQQAQQGELQLEAQQMGNEAQRQQLAAGPQDDGQQRAIANDAARTQAKQKQAQGDIATQRAGDQRKQAQELHQVRLQQERQKLTNLKRPASQRVVGKPKPKQKVAKGLCGPGCGHLAAVGRAASPSGSLTALTRAMQKARMAGHDEKEIGAALRPHVSEQPLAKRLSAFGVAHEGAR